MKTRITTCLVFLLSFSALVFGTSTEARAQALPSVFSIQSLANELTSPEKIARFIFRNFSVESDQTQFGREEFWQSPAELLFNKKGDCEDFALFAAEILKANGISAFIVNVYGKKFAHTVCVFKDQGKYHVIDGDEVKLYDAQNLNDLFSKFYPHWETAAMVTYSAKENAGHVLKFFRK